MIHTGPNPGYPHMRLASVTIAIIALAVAVTDVAGTGTVLAWVVAGIALITFGASFILKS